MFRALTVAAPLAVALAAAAAAAAGDRNPQHELIGSSHHKTVRATLGTHCTAQNGAMRCADFGYPLDTKGRLPVHGGGRIVLRFGEEPEEIDPSLRDRRSRSVHELTARGTGLRRTIRLPRRLPRGSDRLGVFVGYERGDADFEIDLKRHRH
jgi:hypothetical protein